MISIKDKSQCVGCSACMQICPKQCITMLQDNQGFLYPCVDEAKCIECNKCVSVCPVINQSEEKKPRAVYAAWNENDKIREKSSSGGCFYQIAKSVIDRGGVVFGARFDDKWNVVHSYCDTLDGIQQFQQSKYLQSRIGNTYREVEKFLKAGRITLFSGTPCQIAGLHKFLTKDYGELLVTVDVVCHGCPSPKVWEEYLAHIMSPKFKTFFHLRKKDEITKINFRDKRNGWSAYGISIGFRHGKELFETHLENIYMRCFLHDLSLRPSCFHCPSKAGKSGSDITLADFWGVESVNKNLYSSKGVSLVLINSPKGDKIVKKQAISICEVDYKDGLAKNPSIEKSVAKPIEYDDFWTKFSDKGFKTASKIVAPINKSLFAKGYRFLKRIFKIN